MDMLTAKSIMNSFTTDAIGLAFGCTDLGKRSGDTFIKDKTGTTSAIAMTKGVPLTNKIMFRRIINILDNSITVFMAIGYGEYCIDVLEVYSVVDGNAWVYNRLSETEQEWTNVHIRKDGVLQPAVKEWKEFELHLAEEFAKLIRG